MPTAPLALCVFATSCPCSSWHDATVSDRNHEEDPLRAAMDRVRGTAHPPKPAAAAPVAGENVVPLRPRRRPAIDVRGRVADVLSRVDEPAAAVWPAPVAGLISGLWASVMSLLATALLVIIGWVFAPLGSGQFGDVMRASSVVWLLAEGGAIRWQGATMSLPPLLLTLGILLFQRRAGRWLARAVAVEGLRALISPVLSAVVASASFVAVLSAAIMTDSLRVSTGRTLAGSAVVALLGFAWGVHSEMQLKWPGWLIECVALARAYVLGILGLGVAVTLVLAGTQRAPFFAVLHAVSGDTTSTLQVLLLCAVYLPTFVLWVVAVLLGAGITVGTGTVVALQSLTLGALPPVPLLALLPNAMPAWAEWCMVCAPGIGAIVLVATKPARTLKVRATAVGIVILGAMLLGLAMAGGIGPGRLMSVGVAPASFAGFTAGWFALVLAVDEMQVRVRARVAASRPPQPEVAVSGT